MRRYIAELIGTALLVIGGVGTAVLAPAAGPLGIALAFGLVLAVLAYAIGPISGCHVNPAVTLGMLLAGRIKPVQAAGYVLAQVIGGIGGAAVVLAVADHRAGYSQAADGLGTNGWGAHSSGGYGFTAAAIVEVVLTFLLVLTVLRVTATPSAVTVAGLPIGLAVLVAHLVAVPIDGTSVNPARSIGPALLHGGAAITQLWLFVVAPLVGAALAAMIHRTLTLQTSAYAPIIGNNSAATPAFAAADEPAEIDRGGRNSSRTPPVDDHADQEGERRAAPNRRRNNKRRSKRR